VLLRSIGAASLGAKRDRILELYGRPRQSRLHRVAAGDQLRVDVYRLHRGTLRVTYQADMVVGLATDSSYYTTPAGFGPGSLVHGAAALHGARWLDCRKAFRKTVGAYVLSFVTGPKQRVVGSVSMLRRKYDEECPKKRS
jgi:hypothetical protein